MVDKERARHAIQEFLAALGHEGPQFADTPARVTDAFADELLGGHHVDIKQLILDGSEVSSRSHDAILIDNLKVSTVCPHHLLVAQGKALVAYVPNGRILGLGTVTKVVDALCRRLVFQEQIAGDIVQALMEHAGASGAFCRLQLSHACLGARGTHQADAQVTTWAGLGTLLDPTLLETVLGRFLVDDATATNAQESALFSVVDETDEISQVHDLPSDEPPRPA